MDHLFTRLLASWQSHRRTDRGDVPGWVLITVMTVSIATAIWAFAQPQLMGMLRSALNSVGG